MVILTEIREEDDAAEEVFAAVLKRKGGPLPFLQAEIDVAQRRSDLFLEPSAAGMAAEAQAEAEKKRRKTTKGEAGRAAEAERMGDPKPNAENGLDLEKYSWTQQLPEVNITVPVPQGTKSTLVICEIMKNHLKVGLKGYSCIIDGELYQPVTVAECFWTIEDGNTLSILLTKQNQTKWWKSVIKGDPEVDLGNIKTSKLPYFDPETSKIVERITSPLYPEAILSSDSVSNWYTGLRALTAIREILWRTTGHQTSSTGAKILSCDGDQASRRGAAPSQSQSG
uniref:CS domain-containing protein n=1 Tax=Leersia perrieri TaxID=77586 RepID=A0A0D9VKY3_9ORYZ